MYSQTQNLMLIHSLKLQIKPFWQKLEMFELKSFTKCEIHLTRACEQYKFGTEKYNDQLKSIIFAKTVYIVNTWTHHTPVFG